MLVYITCDFHPWIDSVNIRLRYGLNCHRVWLFPRLLSCPIRPWIFLAAVLMQQFLYPWSAAYTVSHIATSIKLSNSSTVTIITRMYHFSFSQACPTTLESLCEYSYKSKIYFLSTSFISTTHFVDHASYASASAQVIWYPRGVQITEGTESLWRRCHSH